MTMPIHPPLKWHGGKHYLAKKIIALMPPHLHYVEPYFGGGAVLLAKNPLGVSEAVNDINGLLINFWRTVQSKTEFVLLYSRSLSTPFSEEEWTRARSIIAEPRNDKVSLAMSFFVSCRQSLAGRMMGFAPLSRSRIRNGMNEQASAWMAAVDGLPDVHSRLRRVVILGPKDALEVIRQQDGPQTLFYLDPPYLHETRSTPNVYAYEMTSEQHAALLRELTTIKGKFILSGYPSSLYDLFSNKYGWRVERFVIPNQAAGGKNKRRMIECVWMNY